MISVVKKLWSLFNHKDKKRIVVLLFFVFSGTLFELLGFGIILPFLAVMADPGAITSNQYIHLLYIFISPPSVNIFILWMGLFIIFIFLLKNAYLFFITYYQFWFSTRIHAFLSSRLFRSYLANPYTFHLKRNSAQLLRNMDLISSIINGVLNPVVLLISDTILVSSIFIILLMTDYLSAIIVLLFSSIVIWVYFTMVKKRLHSLGVRQTKIGEVLFKQFNQGLGSIKESKILGRSGFFDEIYTSHIYERNNIWKWTQSVGVLPAYILETVMVSLIILVMILAIYRGFNKESILLTISFFGIASVRLLPSIKRMNSSLSTIHFYTPSLDEVYTDIKYSEMHPIPLSLLPESVNISFQNKIELKEISFAYEGSNDYTIKNLSLTIKKNNTVGFVGETGCGKTTVIDIILGLLEPQKGTVFIDEFDIKNGPASWQRKIGYIPQQIYLMDDTILSNIALGIPDNDVDLKKISNAIKLAQLEEFIKELPKGLYTTIGELGVRLSGGERQRIGIARALYNEPELLIMDEATSSLDNSTEDSFMKAIDSLSGKRTMIIIAHRLTTLKNVDTIFVMSDGQIIDKGKHEELLKTCPEYIKMNRKLL